MKCRICGNVAGNKTYDVREMMFGRRDIFRCFKCNNCGCLQIESYPANIADYYPRDYLSFTALEKREEKSFLKRARDVYTLTGEGLIGAIYSKFRPNDDLKKFSLLKLKYDSRILDVGSGSGHLLDELHQLGYGNLTGADPFVEKDHSPVEGITILKKSLSELAGTFDFIMLNHSLEHMPDQLQQMKNIVRLLDKDGLCMIRVPICSSYAWEKYGVNWVQLDAPRHYYLHTAKSLELLAKNAGLELFDVAYDSSYFQFEGSELYAKDISLKDSNALDSSHLTRSRYKEYRKLARQLNAQGRGDQAIFYFRKAPAR